MRLPFVQIPIAFIILAFSAIPAKAQTNVPKLKTTCPMGYVNNFKGRCVSPVYYEVVPTNGEACSEGWMNIGGGYCKKKSL
ncbi:MAG: hypothetical protein CL862_01595 [Cyanobium sp. NAT70]|nr:hypothetical protein [Cyanobium sp. NAT70]